MSLQDAQSTFDLAHIIFDEAEVNAAIDQLGEAICIDYVDKDPLLLCVMNGGLFFTAELCKRLNFPHQQDYLHATRYNGELRGKQVIWKAVPQTELAGRHVLVVEDILDEGHTLLAIKAALIKQKPASLAVAVLIDKEHQSRTLNINAEYIGLSLPDEQYVFGCGMDYKGYYRHLSAIYAVQNHLPSC